MNNKNVSKDTIDSLPQSQDSICPQPVLEKGYTIGDRIGCGAFSNVYRAKYKNNQNIAVKIIALEHVSKEWKDKCLNNEMKILHKLHHPNIVKVYDIVKTPTRVFIFMDFAENDSVHVFMKKQNGPVDELKARLWFSQVTSAISYMHGQNFAHRDLKNENILLDSDFNAKLTDFGFACPTLDKNLKIKFSNTLCGTAAYVAPEVLNPPYNAKAADMWSLGVCLYEMLTLKKPFDESLSPKKLLQCQLERSWKFPPFIDEKLSDSVKDLIRKLLEPDMDKRLIATKVLKHPWLHSHIDIRQTKN